MDSSKKPFLCDMLGVEVNERWQLKSDTDGRLYRISTEKGLQKLENGFWVRDELFEGYLAAWLFSGSPLSFRPSEVILHKPRWTAEDVRHAKAVRLLHPQTVEVERLGVGLVKLIGKEGYLSSLGNMGVFPSLAKFERASLDEILAAEEKKNDHE